MLASLLIVVDVFYVFKLNIHEIFCNSNRGYHGRQASIIIHTSLLDFCVHYRIVKAIRPSQPFSRPQI